MSQRKSLDDFRQSNIQQLNFEDLQIIPRAKTPNRIKKSHDFKHQTQKIIKNMRATINDLDSDKANSKLSPKVGQIESIDMGRTKTPREPL